MGNLVESLVVPQTEAVDLAEYLQDLETAHNYLQENAHKAYSRAAQIPFGREWASAVKRIPVEFPSRTRPKYIEPVIETHNLHEVINQCATMERLLDALAWAKINLTDYKVLRCHPTTGSSNKYPEIPDNDLVLINPAGTLARFEVSDVVNNEKDSNGKEDKDLFSLGVKKKEKVDGKDKVKIVENTKWETNGRLFLVVSIEFSQLIKGQMTYFYERHYYNEKTVLFEVHKKLS